MEERLFDFVSATFGTAFAVTLVVLLFALWLTHYITKKVTEFKAQHSDIKEEARNIEARVDARLENMNKSIDIRFDHIDKRISKIEGDVDEIRRDMAYLKGSLDIFKNKQNTLMRSHSPISLTEEGEKVAQEMKANEAIDRNWSKISKNLEKLSGANAYDIQTYCIETASVEPELFFDDLTIDRVKTFAFKKGMPLQLLLRLLGLLIRDRYFSENGMPLSAIDNADSSSPSDC